MIVSSSEFSGGWSVVSDRNLKMNFQEVNYKLIYEQLMKLPIYQWEYVLIKGFVILGQWHRILIILFDLGNDDERFITASDVDGVSFISLKYLINEMDSFQMNSYAVDPISLEALHDILSHIEMSVDQLDSSLAMKMDALQFLVDENLTQYEKMDRQLKVLFQIQDVQDSNYLIKQLILVLTLFILSLLLGVFMYKRYYNYKKRRSGNGF